MRVFEPKWDENRNDTKLHNEEFLNSHRSPNIVEVCKYRRRRCTRHLEGMEDTIIFKTIANTYVGKILISLVLDQRIILKWKLNKYV